MLDPDIVLRADGGALAGASRLVRGAQAVASQAAAFSKAGLSSQVVLAEWRHRHRLASSGRPVFSLLAFTVRGGTIIEINILADPERLEPAAICRLSTTERLDHRARAAGERPR